jgi:hypothetical protein
MNTAKTLARLSSRLHSTAYGLSEQPPGTLGHAALESRCLRLQAAVSYMQDRLVREIERADRAAEKPEDE